MREITKGKVTTREKNLTNEQRQQIYEALLTLSNGGNMKKNTIALVALVLGVKRSLVQAIWRRVKECRALEIPIDVSSRKPKNCGRKKIQVDLSQVAHVPLRRRRTIWSLARAIGVNRSTLHRCFKEGKLRCHSSSLIPYLKEANKKQRLEFCVSMLEESSLPNNPRFKDMRNIVHLDEKWFNGTKNTRTMYMAPDEEDPHRTVQKKNYITKVMFLSAQTRPRYDEEGNCYFDGKIGLWPFVREVTILSKFFLILSIQLQHITVSSYLQDQAKRRSQNRERGDPVTKTMIVDRQTMKSYLIGRVLPEIKRRWPRESRHETIWIQQDNARTHVPADDLDFLLAVAQTGLDIRLMQQPPNSPDMNILDLVFLPLYNPRQMTLILVVSMIL
jgi:DNA-binding phage protein